MSKVILFQGDSITDCSRNRQDFYNMGFGYANLTKGFLGMEHPNEYQCVNRGVSGDRIVDLYARIKCDFININPDYASIFVGVNDAWHEISGRNGVDTEKFERIYSMYLDEIYAVCPNVKIFLIAPYVLEGSATCGSEDMPDRYERFVKDVGEKAEAVKRIGKKYYLPVVELQPAFDEACKQAPADYWTLDGVHPSICGHEMIKRLWLEAFEKIK